MIGAVVRVIAMEILVDDLQKTNQTYNILFIQVAKKLPAVLG